MRMRRILTMSVAVIVVASSVGFLSNLAFAEGVEAQVHKECDANIAQAVVLWRLPIREIRHLPPSAIHMRTEVTAQGKHVTVQAPPSAKPPYSYAHATTVAPFVLRVRYGWAVAGSRMTFGQGGEQFVLSLFGSKTRLLDRPEWHF
jgi:hypothetical protein